MIASIADEGQSDDPAPFGVALSKTGGAAPPGNRRRRPRTRQNIPIYIFSPVLSRIKLFPERNGQQLLMGAAGAWRKRDLSLRFTYAAFAKSSYDFTIHQVIAEEYLNVKYLRSAAGPDDGLAAFRFHRATEDLGDYARHSRHGYQSILRCAGDRAGGTGNCRP